jgi:hypothetical protein
MRMLYTLVAATFSVAAQAATDCVAERSSARPHLVELYTSEGCSSCPPADDWLRRIPAPSNIVALAFHVDYWDYLGWHDRFSESRFTTRQQEQASRDHAGGIYTPQVVLDGHSWTNWYRGSLPASPSTAAATMRVTTTSGARLHVHVDTTMDNAADATGFRNYIALTEDGLSSQVGAGENRGVLLHHDHVVRAFVGPLPLAGGETEFMLPGDIDTAHSSVVAFAQRARDGEIAQVLSCKL